MSFSPVASVCCGVSQLPKYFVHEEVILSHYWSQLYCHTSGHSYSESKNIWKHSNLQQMFNCCAKLNLKFILKKIKF